MNEPGIRLSRTAGVARIVVTNPERRNALTVAMKRRLIQTFGELDQDEDTRCIVLSGAGTKAFVSGADISEFEQQRSGADAEERYMRMSAQALLLPAMVSKPVIASIRGACAGGGLQLAVACDIRIASRDAFFVMPAARLGVGLPYAGIALLVSLLGRGRASDILLSARRLPAQEALEIGLVNRVVPEAELDEAVAACADSVAANAPLTLRLFKASLTSLATPPSTPTPIQALLDACGASADAVEGRTAFKEKRDPTFKGR